MSSPAQGGPPPQKDKGKEKEKDVKEKKGFGKVLSRVKTVLKKAAEPSRRLSTLGGSKTDKATTSAAAEAKASTRWVLFSTPRHIENPS
jgi:hypothetical protein